MPWCVCERETVCVTPFGVGSADQRFATVNAHDNLVTTATWPFQQPLTYTNNQLTLRSAQVHVPLDKHTYADFSGAVPASRAQPSPRHPARV